MKDKNRILFVYHPQLWHLKPDNKGFIWNHFVSDVLKEVCAEYDLSFYDATFDLKAIFKTNPEKYYLKNDMHFNEDGLKAYSILIEDKLLPKISP
jgi:lysophospholipase L1-like esterase